VPEQYAVPTVAPADVAPDACVLDVREPYEWAAGHIAGALHIPLASLPQRLAEVPTDRPVIVACRSGGRSSQAVAYLTTTGRDALNLDGGTQAWAATGRDMRSETDQPPSVI
jgi:rhodanese-related sulfurtransferase